jgi:hypothetical protein
MKRILILTLFFGAFTFLSNLSAFSQDSDQQIVFIFAYKKAALVDLLNSNVDKTVGFEISGISSDEVAVSIQKELFSFSEKILNVEISKENNNGRRNGSISLHKDVLTAYFTKLIFTVGVKNIIVDGVLMKTTDLNN